MNSILSCRSEPTARSQLAAAPDHIIENGVQSQLILASPLRNDLSDPGAVSAEKGRSRRRVAVSMIGGEDAAKIPIVHLRIIDRVVGAFAFVVFGQRLREPAQRVDAAGA